jgi:MFS family permease
MVAIMTIVPVHLVHHGHGLDLIGVVVGCHVAGMFLPSPLSGWAVDRVGPRAVALSGIGILVVVGLAGIVIDQGSAPALGTVLVLLGIAWNGSIVGASALLTATVPANARLHAEGIGETAMGLAAAGGAPIASVIAAAGGFASLSVITSAVAVLALAVIWWVRQPPSGHRSLEQASP